MPHAHLLVLKIFIHLRAYSSDITLKFRIIMQAIVRQCELSFYHQEKMDRFSFLDIMQRSEIAM